MERSILRDLKKLEDFAISEAAASDRDPSGWEDLAA